MVYYCKIWYRVILGRFERIVRNSGVYYQWTCHIKTLDRIEIYLNRLTQNVSHIMNMYNVGRIIMFIAKHYSFEYIGSLI